MEGYPPDLMMTTSREGIRTHPRGSLEESSMGFALLTERVGQPDTIT